MIVATTFKKRSCVSRWARKGSVPAGRRQIGYSCGLLVFRKEAQKEQTVRDFPGSNQGC